MPVVRQYIPKRRVNTALRRHRVRTRGKDLGDYRDMRLRLRQLQRSSESGTASADHETIEAPSGNVHGYQLPKRICTDHSASTSKAVAVPS